MCARGSVGSSSAGKNTLLRCSNLLELPGRGEGWAAGRSLTELALPELSAARCGIGMVHQRFALWSSRTVAGNVAFPLVAAGVSRVEGAEVSVIRTLSELLPSDGVREYIEQTWQGMNFLIINQGGLQR